MPIQIFDRDTHLDIQSVNENGRLDHVPAGVYKIHHCPAHGLQLRRDRKVFTVPERKYGKHRKYLSRLLRDYDRLGPALGILLHGLKGSGKTMLAEDFCNSLLGRGVPVFLIDEAISPDTLRTVIAVTGPCVIFMDEFGKMYDAEGREKMLTLFSDSELRGVVFLVTANDLSEELSDYMIDRPGRFRFRIPYTDVPAETALEIAQDYHLNQELTDALVRYAAGAHTSFDIVCKLASIATECKTVEDLDEEVSILNMPKLIWHAYKFTHIHYKGEELSAKRVDVSVQNDMAAVLLLKEDGTEDSRLTVNLFDSACERRSVSVNSVSTSDALAAKVGTYVLKVSAELTITFERFLYPMRNYVANNVQTEKQRKQQEEHARRHGLLGSLVGYGARAVDSEVEEEAETE